MKKIILIIVVILLAVVAYLEYKNGYIRSVFVDQTECSDGIDNDNNRQIDLADSKCENVLDNNEKFDSKMEKPEVDVRAFYEDRYYIDENVYIKSGDSVEVGWLATIDDETDCKLSGGWSGKVSEYGGKRIIDKIENDTEFTMICKKGGQESSDSVLIKIIK